MNHHCCSVIVVVLSALTLVFAPMTAMGDELSEGTAEVKGEADKGTDVQNRMAQPQATQPTSFSPMTIGLQLVLGSAAMAAGGGLAVGLWQLASISQAEMLGWFAVGAYLVGPVLGAGLGTVRGGMWRGGRENIIGTVLGGSIGWLAGVGFVLPMLEDGREWPPVLKIYLTMSASSLAGSIIGYHLNDLIPSGSVAGQLQLIPYADATRNASGALLSWSGRL